MFNAKLAQEAMVESLNHHIPCSESHAEDIAREALLEEIDTGLIYTHDILELWDCSTHENIVLSDFDDIMAAITASTAEQLMEDYDCLVFDSIDEYILENINLHDLDEKVDRFEDSFTWGEVLNMFEVEGSIDRDDVLDKIAEGHVN